MENPGIDTERPGFPFNKLAPKALTVLAVLGWLLHCWRVINPGITS